MGAIDKQLAVYHAEQFHSGSEEIGVAGDGVGYHGASVAASADGDAGRVNETAGYQVLGSGSHIVDFTSIGVFDIEVTDELSVAGAAAIAGFADSIAGLSKILRPRI